MSVFNGSAERHELWAEQTQLATAEITITDVRRPQKPFPNIAPLIQNQQLINFWAILCRHTAAIEEQKIC